MFFFKSFTQITPSLIGVVFLFFIIVPSTVAAQGREQQQYLSGFLSAMDSLAPIISGKTAAGNASRKGYRPSPFYKPNYQQRRLPSSARTAASANCRDTSSRIAFVKDSIHFYVTNPATTRNGDLLISGEYYNFWDKTTRG